MSVTPTQLANAAQFVKNYSQGIPYTTQQMNDYNWALATGLTDSTILSRYAASTTPTITTPPPPPPPAPTPSVFLLAKGGAAVTYTDPTDIAKQQAGFAAIAQTNPELVARIESGEQAKIVEANKAVAAAAIKIDSVIAEQTTVDTVLAVKPIAEMSVAEVQAQVDKNIETIYESLSNIGVSESIYNRIVANDEWGEWDWSKYPGGKVGYISDTEKNIALENDLRVQLKSLQDYKPQWTLTINGEKRVFDSLESAQAAADAGRKWSVILDGKESTFDTKAEAQLFSDKNRKWTITIAGKELTFDSYEAALKAAEFQPMTVTGDKQYELMTVEPQVIEPSEFTAIPGPGAGPKPGSIGAGISELLTGTLKQTEATLENVALSIRSASSDSWVKASEAKDLNDVVSTIGYASLGTAERLAAGIYEGATFIIRPVMWGGLAALPIEVVANPQKYWGIINADPGGIALEAIGGVIGGYAVGGLIGRVAAKVKVSELTDVTVNPLVKGNINGVEIMPTVAKSTIPRTMVTPTAVVREGSIKPTMMSLVEAGGDMDVLVGTSEGGLTRGVKLTLTADQVKSLISGKKVWVETGESSIYTTPGESLKVFMGAKPEVGVVGGLKEFKELGPDSPFYDLPEVSGPMGGRGDVVSSFKMKVIGGLKTEDLLPEFEFKPLTPDPSIIKTSLNKIYADLVKIPVAPSIGGVPGAPVVSILDTIKVGYSPVAMVSDTAGVYSAIGATVGGVAALQSSLSSIGIKDVNRVITISTPEVINRVTPVDIQPILNLIDTEITPKLTPILSTKFTPSIISITDLTPIQVSALKTIPTSLQIPFQEPLQIPTQTPVQIPIMEPVQAPKQEPIQEPIQEPWQEPIQEPVPAPIPEPTPTPTPTPKRLFGFSKKPELKKRRDEEEERGSMVGSYKVVFTSKRRESPRELEAGSFHDALSRTYPRGSTPRMVEVIRLGVRRK